MASEELRHLVRMVNQITLNLGEERDPELAAEQTEQHLRRFWTPAMRRELQDYWQGGGEGLSPVAERVAEALADEDLA